MPYLVTEASEDPSVWEDEPTNMTSQPPMNGSKTSVAQEDQLCTVASHPVKEGNELGFGRAAEVLIRQAHVLNRRVTVAVVWSLPPPPDGDVIPCDVTRTLCARLGVVSPEAVAGCAALDVLDGGQPAAGCRQLAIRKLVPRQAGLEAELELVVKDGSSVGFLPLQSGSRLIPPFPHKLQLVSGDIRLVAPPSAVDTPSARWLAEHALPKMARWTVDLATEAARPLGEHSLQLVDAEQYTNLYMELKEKYGAEFVKIWPENTDPLKFVYEDVAIAAYLLLLWQNDRRTLQLELPQTFVDIGCGNGLLVHILCSEGHPGYGVDIRSRGIWKMYPTSTRLEVATITPSAETTYPGCDWLIGNHSDELTPWLPVMAAATGPDTSFFLLPCCPWDFYSKYQRCNTRLSQYEEYMQYVYELAERCGFAPERDRLRIPSTRRRCVVGRRRAAAVSADALRQLTAAGTFRPRAAAPAVRNCSQLARETVAEAVRRVALRVVADGALPLSAVAELLGGDTLRQLRQQCGGLQTLLKNHPHVFRVRAGAVSLQDADWLRVDGARPELAASVKTSRCWQHDHLPAGCPLPAPQCRYAHGGDDLRSRHVEHVARTVD
ncbi:LOW QUALITY PROTEIN: probable tRNA (uracil-O(2)-)-methyltransferase [Pollicipes pollicipes]|uniref:LOW QUALITY PROTEIN: probable tRNA (uracil-O(2)-)-methyltransferase n=1 Tax=Pollicipes pollicipes TaxID=41117 RepID=UPI0018857F12|nr:LOW QUALITY PROTEIN: probable tRNA (uracil-O(2)-)-methyltransferase [Pollicipes pollicipes]